MGSCSRSRPWVMHFVLELKVILVYLRAVLLVYFLYKVFLLDVLKAVEPLPPLVEFNLPQHQLQSQE